MIAGPFSGHWWPQHSPEVVALNAPAFPPFAKTPEDATERFERWVAADPFPDVAAALLNSADLVDYIAEVGILQPYSIPEGKDGDWIKPASCALPCGGEFVRYERPRGAQKPKMITGLVGETGLSLPRNSITYLLLDTTFRLPNYIAARFNLTIREIHRGILLGTGPLVDPGFEGRLLIPLHNLTNNDYQIDVGEPLVWVEFTKLSGNREWRAASPAQHRAPLIGFPRRKIEERKTARAYLKHANAGRPIMSSVAEIDDRSTNTERVVRDTRRFSIGVAVAVIALIATLFAGAVGAFVYTLTYTNGQVGNGKQALQEVSALKKQLCAIPGEKSTSNCK